MKAHRYTVVGQCLLQNAKRRQASLNVHELMKVFYLTTLVGLLSTVCLWAASAETLDYDIEWHLIRAGSARILLTPEAQGWKAEMKLESAGTVSRLYRISDTYNVQADSKWCSSASVLDAQEGKKHYITRLAFDQARHKVTYNSQDFLRNANTQKELQTAPCAREILSALVTLRTLNLEPGKSGALAVTDGKKFATARVEAQVKEPVLLNGKQYGATRYEAFLFDNVLYKRHGRLLIWISDDAEHLPLQMRFQMGFPVGNVLVQLQRPAKSQS